MKTPDEIKKGLATHESDTADCIECPYEHVDTQEEWEHCVINMAHDALAYIKQLEAKAELVEQYRWERDVAIDQLEQLGIGFGEKVNGKFPRWISVEEKLPEDGQPVIVFATHTDRWSGHWHAVMEDCWCGGGWDANCDEDIHKVTHWMPMPEPPVEV